MRIHVWVLVAGLAWSSVPETADAQLGSLFRAARRAGSAGRAAGRGASTVGRTGRTLGRAADGAGHVGNVARRGALLGAGGILLDDMRVTRLFHGIPDEAGRTALYATDDMVGGFTVVERGGSRSMGQDLGSLVDGADDVYIDLPLARDAQSLPELGDKRMFVLDAEGQPHRIEVEESADGVIEYVVDVAGEAMDLADFADAETEDQQEEFGIGGLGVSGLDAAALVPPVEEEESSNWWMWALGIFGVLGFLYWLGGKTPEEEAAELEASVPPSPQPQFQQRTDGEAKVSWSKPPPKW